MKLLFEKYDVKIAIGLYLKQEHPCFKRDIKDIKIVKSRKNKEIIVEIELDEGLTEVSTKVNSEIKFNETNNNFSKFVQVGNPINEMNKEKKKENGGKVIDLETCEPWLRDLLLPMVKEKQREKTLDELLNE